MTDWSADPWFAEHAWVAPRVGETRRSGFKSLRPHAFSDPSPRNAGSQVWRQFVARVYRRGLSPAAGDSDADRPEAFTSGRGDPRGALRVRHDRRRRHSTRVGCGARVSGLAIMQRFGRPGPRAPTDPRRVRSPF